MYNIYIDTLHTVIQAHTLVHTIANSRTLIDLSHTMQDQGFVSTLHAIRKEAETVCCSANYSSPLM